MQKALGITCEDLAVTEDVLGQLREMFDSPVQEQQLRVIVVILGKIVPTNLASEMEQCAWVAI